MSIDGTLSATYNINDRRTVGLGTAANIATNQQPATSFSNGTAGAQAQVSAPLSRTFSGTTDILDLFAGLADAYTTPVVLNSVRGIFIQNTGNANIVVGDAGSNPWNTFLNATGTITLPPGAWIVAATPDATGWVVGTSTNVNLLVTGTSGQTYSIAFLGTGT